MDATPTTPDESLHDHTQYGELDYPVEVYYVELSKMYMHMLRWHWHAEVEVIIVNHGEADFMADDTVIRLKAGQGVFVNQNVIHAVHAIDSMANCSLYSVVVHPSFLFGYGATVMSTKYLLPITSSPSFQILKLTEEDAWQEHLLDCINGVIAANLTKRYGYELTVKAHLCHFWTTLLEKIVPQNVTNTKQSMLSLDEMRVKEAILYIEEHYSEAVALDELASALHISKSECCRCFKRTLQLTPIEYLMKYRIFRAASLLQKGDDICRSISDLAFAVGFNNASYFNKVFKEYLNCTPSEYKRNLKKDPTNQAGSFQAFKF